MFEAALLRDAVSSFCVGGARTFVDSTFALFLARDSCGFLYAIIEKRIRLHILNFCILFYIKTKYYVIIIVYTLLQLLIA